MKPKGFNSMIVRLKAYFLKFVEEAKQMFQFYDSPIKSEKKMENEYEIMM